MVYLIAYPACILFSGSGHYLLSGLVLLLAAVALFLQDLRKPGAPLLLRAVFSLSFVGGQALSCLKLSRLQVDWEPMMWCMCFLAFMVFWLTVEWGNRRFGVADEGRRMGASGGINTDRLWLGTVGITVISWISFLAEAKRLGYVPLLVRGVPHAYSYFHISGLHYFTVSAVLVPAFAAVWFGSTPRASAGKRRGMAACAVFSLLIPLLCVSRFQLLLSVFTAIASFLVLERSRLPVRTVLLTGAALIPLYLLLTAARSHSAAYLNGIFEMKRNLPVFVSQPYIYIANNYDNLNCLIRELPRHSFGLRMLFPLWALSGLKLIVPSLTALPLFVTKTELTTLTLFYDAWYDFGVLGVVSFSALLALLALWMEHRVRDSHHPLFCVFYAQIAVYLSLSFFTTWFSNPATWFYFMEIAALRLFVGSATRRTGYGPV